ncbi:hypothetical protein AZH53_00485 [Methanomicrobiaceae archaeon CYW5]|nr:hypothetical protein [Methanovulcanius yangii]
MLRRGHPHAGEGLLDILQVAIDHCPLVDIDENGDYSNIGIKGSKADAWDEDHPGGSNPPCRLHRKCGKVQPPTIVVSHFGHLMLQQGTAGLLSAL